MADIPGKKITEEDSITELQNGNDWFIIGRDIGPTNKNIRGTDIKRNFTGVESKTIDASGEISILNPEPINFMTIDTFGAAATDNLVKINGGHPGQLIILQAANSARTVVINDTANIRCASGAGFNLNHVNDKWQGIVVSSGNIDEISRSDNT